VEQIEKFFTLFLEELKHNQELRHYHRFINSEKLYTFRRAYYQQRLEYIVKNLNKNDASILDVGCGYGTTSILLGFLGYKVIGTTLEYYYKEIENRLSFWENYFDTSKLEFRYENLFKSNYKPGTFDYIIAQDTLHHLEPINQALSIMSSILAPNGKLLVSEENGNNIINNLKNFKRRGNKRIIKIFDEKLGEELMFGNENTRSLAKWTSLMREQGLLVEEGNVEYIRVLPPSSYTRKTLQEVIKKEKELSKKSKLLREYLFFGINFMAHKAYE
jgi:SAM-dependent methyltransferase